MAAQAARSPGAPSAMPPARHLRALLLAPGAASFRARLEAFFLLSSFYPFCIGVAISLRCFLIYLNLRIMSILNSISKNS